jgi:DNA-binding Xre family transcriptional regulator
MKNTIKSLAAAKGLNLSELAQQIGKSPSNMTTTLKHGNPRLSFLTEVCEKLGAELIIRDNETKNEFKL